MTLCLDFLIGKSIMIKKAVFIDRDGTINVDKGYINHEDLFELIPSVAQAIRQLNKNNFLVFIVSNQSGLARGFFSQEVLDKVHQRMNRLLSQKNAHYDALYYCPHHPDGMIEEFRKDCDCRKPKTGLFKKALKDFEFDIKSSFMVGDKPSDIEFGKRCGLKTIMVLTGYGKGEFIYRRHNWKVKPDYIADDLLSAVELILFLTK